MTDIIEIDYLHRGILYSLFQSSRYDTVLINSVLEGHFGTAYADSATHPSVARLDSGAFTMLNGNPKSKATISLLKISPIRYVTPETEAWKDVILKNYSSHVTQLTFTEFHTHSLDTVHLKGIIDTLPKEFRLRKIDAELAKRLSHDLQNEYFFENFYSIEDFLKRGIGHCIVYKEQIVSAATSMARCNNAIDIEIETLPDFRRKGLGTVVGAQIVLYCIENGIEPKWLAANPASEQLALNLGYTKGESYITFEITR